MFLVPFEKLKMHSPHDGDLLLRKLKDSIEPEQQPFGWKSDHKPYEGRVQGDTFQVSRNVYYQYRRGIRSYWFRPQIRGSIERGFGCSVTITMFSHPLVIAFMAGWLGIGLSVLALVFSALIRGNQPRGGPNELLFMLFMLVLMLLGYAIALIGFKVESSKAKTFFRHLFEPDKVEEASLQEILQAVLGPNQNRPR